jgi:uncharacterized protein YndB with AHSA1/START domain
MARTQFVYVIYIAAAAETVWHALLDGEFTRKYWEADNVSDWTPGSSWEHRRADASRAVRILGEVLEAVPPRRLVLTWADPKERQNRAAYSRVAFDLEEIGGMVRLTVTHDELDAGSDMHKAISTGWPRVLSSLKSLLETGHPLKTWAGR